MTDELRMNAYYYSFEPTGVREIDVILSAIARAGKAYHNTEGWGGGLWDDKPEYPEEPFVGDNWIDRIQNAANTAAEEWKRDRA